MIQWPVIQYRGVTIKFPDTVDVFDFMAWFEEKYYGLSPAVIAQRRADEAALEQQMARMKKK